MLNHDISTTIQLIKKTSNNLPLFQILYSHLISLVTNFDKSKYNPHNTDPFSTLLIYGALHIKCPIKSIEKDALTFLKDNKTKKSLTNTQTLKIIIIVSYFINQDILNINFFILNELLNNYVFKNTFLDILILKFLFRGIALSVYDMNVKNRIQDDIIISFLIQCRSNCYGFAFCVSVLPLFAFYDVVPPDCIFHNLNECFQYRYIESLYFYAKYARSVKNIEQFFKVNRESLKALRLYICKENEIIDDVDEEVDMKILVSDNSVDLSFVKNQYNMIVNKKKFVKELLDWIKTLE